MESNPTEWLKQLFEKEEWSEDDRRRLLEYLDNTDDDALRSLMERRFNEDSAQHRRDTGETAASPGEDRHAASSGEVGRPARPGTEDRLLALIHEKIAPAPAKDKARLFSLTGWRKWAVAAILLVVAGKFLLDRYTASRLTSPGARQPVIAAADRPPGTQNATLTLADGTMITLDSAANGNLAQQGGTKVIKLNGQIAYSNTGGANDIPLLNTISTARGNQYMLVLSDGSKVWLNAASSMKFPTSFKGKERRVEITGEAYFEIADNPSMPFKVVAGGGEIQVLGTHFNVNAYNDESTIKTTLLEGAVAVQKEQSRLVLAPGQQARFSPGSTSGPGSTTGPASRPANEESPGSPTKTITLLKDIDAGQETAWKDGYFWFNNTDIRTLMRQVSRWYDVEVIFKGNFPDDGFSGKVSRHVPLSKLLQVLEQYEIHFEINGKKITVLP